jgi:hypothetical protein
MSARGRNSAGALAVVVALALSGCSGRTTGATEITRSSDGTVSATLTAVGSCDQGCTAFMRWRQLGQSAWTNAEPFNVGRATNAPWKQVATGLSSDATYEYQACGKENSSSGFACVGASGRPGTTQKFVARPEAGGWPQYHYDRAVSGKNPFEITLDTGNADELTRSWSGRFPNSAAVVGSPVVSNGVVYVTVAPTPGSSYLEAYRAFCATGGGTCNPLWRAPIGGDTAGAAPVVADGKVFVGGDRLYVFPASGCSGSNCTPSWTGTTGGQITSSPTFSDASIYVGTGGADRRLYSFSASGCGQPTCTAQWSKPTFGPVSTAAVGPVLRGTGVIVGAEQGVYTFTDGGTLVGRQATDGNVTPPLLTGDLIAVGSAAGKIYAFQPLGNLVWTGATGGPVVAPPAFSNNTYYVGSGDGKLYAFSASCNSGGGSCTPMWTGATGAPIRTAPAIANGVVYIASSDGKLYEFAAGGCGTATCAPLGSQTFGSGATPQSSPAVAGGAVYIGAQGGSGAASGGASLQAYSLP